ncbi:MULTISPECIES: hypothetical protein [Actinoalloteichus]|uniref:Uncharacterized protein n=1 Tax=Actinoalloteichus fjordicus TaxID=1612552 RepID=A0AAC9LGF8_9PSEU|nr:MULTISPECIES: hypothetical protein [Actinoalloteichus]APU17478.1 hypothetical protein UA74_27375 [Actinoalloteichus fjordicus]APU23555.1 hypothetical protein UA75_27920 [Actinoalloteichus sp. GBA129-24]
MADGIRLELVADWAGGPFFVTSAGERSGDHYVDEIASVVPLSSDLLDDVKAWDDHYQGLLDQQDPAGSGFASAEDRDRFLTWGRELARRVRAECPAEVTVTYAGDGSLDELIR